jgi:hypothetical protein
MIKCPKNKSTIFFSVHYPCFSGSHAPFSFDPVGVLYMLIDFRLCTASIFRFLNPSEIRELLNIIETIPSELILWEKETKSYQDRFNKLMLETW